MVSENFYWLSTKEDTLDWKHRQDTVYTPQAEFGDLSGLNSLPQINLTARRVSGKGSEQVTITNPGNAIAFMVHLRVTRGKDGEDVTPILWQDNYFSLLPGESLTVTAKFDSSLLEGKEAIVELDGWNAVSATLGTSAN